MDTRLNKAVNIIVKVNDFFNSIMWLPLLVVAIYFSLRVISNY